MEHTMTEDQAMGNDLDNVGFCDACGEIACGVEPDAREYECEACGARKVYGAQELVMMGQADIVG